MIDRKEDTKRYYGRIVWVGLLSIVMVSGLGCGNANSNPDTTKKREEILQEHDCFTYETNSLEDWEKNLTYTGEGVITMEGIRGIKVSLNGEDKVSLSYEPRDYKNTYDCWAISKPYDSLAYVDTEAMYEYFSLIENMPLQVVDEENADTFGTTVGELYVAYYSMQTEDGGSPYPDQGVRFLFGNVTEDGYQYVMIEGVDSLFVMQKEYADTLLLVDPFRFVLQVVNVVMMDTVSELEIATQLDYLNMTYDGKEYKMNGKKISFEEYNAFYTELMTVFIAGEVPEDYGMSDSSDASNEEVIIALHYHRNVEGAPDISVQYVSYDDQYVVARINGKSFFMVEKSEVANLICKIGEK